MSSRHAQRMQDRGRAMLWREHAETVVLRDGNTDTDLEGIWARVQPQVIGEDGIGVQAYTGEATLVVRVEDLTETPSPRALILRNGEEWAIRHHERQDEWTWILHLAKPRGEMRIPDRLRR